MSLVVGNSPQEVPEPAAEFTADEVAEELLAVVAEQALMIAKQKVVIRKLMEARDR
jgi:hypothetical protein